MNLCRFRNGVKFALAGGILLLGIHTAARADLLEIRALNDKPGPVNIRVEAWNLGGTQIHSSVVSWVDDDNLYSIKSLTIPAASRVLRLTFQNDTFICCDPDDDRNAFIDFFRVDGFQIEGEDFDRTGGPDPQFPGCGMSTIFNVKVTDCGNQFDYVEYDLEYFKAPYANYAPSGMPDFDQKQDAWADLIVCGPDGMADTTANSTLPADDVQLLTPGTTCASSFDPVVDKGPNGIMDTAVNPNDIFRYEYCVPTAVANCLWWFDSKFETDQAAAACDGSDTYDMVTAYSTSTDDHCTNNVDDTSTPPGGVAPNLNTAFGELVEDLAWRMDTGGQRTGNTRFGTSVADMETAVRQYLNERGLSDEYIVNLVAQPDFDFISREVKRSQDLVLNISFVQNCQGIYQFVGGHAVTTAGVVSDPTDRQVCISDPFYDLAELGSTGRALPAGPHLHTGPPETIHNDALNISHDCYPVQASASPFGPVGLGGYGNVIQAGQSIPEIDCTDILNFVDQNNWDPENPEFEPFPCDPNCSLEAVISFTLEISPFFWKADHPNYAPSGMPDFDQKQNGTAFQCSGNWSYCGPTAVADSFWWFDSKFETNLTGSPCDGNDTYDLVQADPAATDDHCDDNVVPLIDTLGLEMNTDDQNPGWLPARGGFCGTYVEDMERGILAYLNLKGLGNDYYVNVERAPEFAFVAEEVEKSQDLILLLGFWQLQDQGGGPVWVRIGGHYVTVAGVDRAGGLIAFSDPYLDSAETGGSTGRVRGILPHDHPAVPTNDIHNDAQNISHDLFEVIATNSPGGIWGPKDYVGALGSDISNFIDQNGSDELDSEEHVTGPPFGPEPIVAEVDYAIEVSPCPPDLDNDGYRPICDGDCDDTDPNINPGAQEVCDGLDNNCDGTIDEGFPVGTSCTAGTGICLANGVFVCTADTLGTECDAVPGPPDVEICDGLDNNCDGQTDEGFPVGDPCTGLGECGPGTVECDPSGARCSTDPGGSQDQSAPEVCDLLDNDCDGFTDEDFQPDGIRLDAHIAPLPDEIQLHWTGGQPPFDVYGSDDPSTILDPGNFLGSTPDREWIRFTPEPLYFFKIISPCLLDCPERCDGVDNDCNGLTDEGCAPG